MLDPSRRLLGKVDELILLVWGSCLRLLRDRETERLYL